MEGFLRAMQKQLSSAGKRGFFSKRTVGIQVREKFTFEDMLCFQKVLSLKFLYNTVPLSHLHAKC